MNYVYAIEAVGTNYVKIGTTTDLDQRLVNLSTGCPHEVRYVGRWEGDLQTETAIHQALVTYRRRGEWFDIGAERAVWEVTRLLGHAPFTDREIYLLGQLDVTQQDRAETSFQQAQKIRELEAELAIAKAVPFSEPQSLRDWRIRAAAILVLTLLTACAAPPRPYALDWRDPATGRYGRMNTNLTWGKCWELRQVSQKTMPGMEFTCRNKDVQPGDFIFARKRELRGER